MIDPAKRLVGAGLLAGGAEAAEGEIDGGGQLEPVQPLEVHRQPVAAGGRFSRLATEQGQLMLWAELADQRLPNQAGCPRDQDLAHACLLMTQIEQNRPWPVLWDIRAGW
ncbi:hypothetical protein D3C78_1528020 [compost metagenome]